MDDIRLITKAEAARLLDVDEKTVRRLVEGGVLREVQLGPRGWLVRAELVELVTGSREPVGASP